MTPLNLFADIEGGAIRNLAQNLFPGFFARGISANQALRELQSEGLGYKRADFLEDFRMSKASFDVESTVKYLDALDIPSDKQLEPKYHGTPDHYSFVFRAGYTDPETGESDDRYFFYHRNSTDSKAQLENDAYDWVTTEAENYPIDINEVELVEGYINPIWA